MTIKMKIVLFTAVTALPSHRSCVPSGVCSVSLLSLWQDKAASKTPAAGILVATGEESHGFQNFHMDLF